VCRTHLEEQAAALRDVLGVHSVNAVQQLVLDLVEHTLCPVLVQRPPGEEEFDLIEYALHNR